MSWLAATMQAACMQRMGRRRLPPAKALWRRAWCGCGDWVVVEVAGGRGARVGGDGWGGGGVGGKGLGGGGGAGVGGGWGGGAGGEPVGWVVGSERVVVGVDGGVLVGGLGALV